MYYVYNRNLKGAYRPYYIRDRGFYFRKAGHADPNQTDDTILQVAVYAQSYNSLYSNTVDGPFFVVCLYTIGKI